MLWSLIPWSQINFHETTNKEEALERMGQDSGTLDAVPGSGTSSLDDLFQSANLWISYLNEKTDLEALKP